MSTVSTVRIEKHKPEFQWVKVGEEKSSQVVFWTFLKPRWGSGVGELHGCFQKEWETHPNHLFYYFNRGFRVFGFSYNYNPSKSIWETTLNCEVGEAKCSCSPRNPIDSSLGFCPEVFPKDMFRNQTYHLPLPLQHSKKESIVCMGNVVAITVTPFILEFCRCYTLYTRVSIYHTDPWFLIPHRF